MVEHRNIIDAERHEPKGAGSATSGFILSSIGSGATSFIDPKTLKVVSVASVLEAANLSTQNPSGTDVATQVSFGAGGSNSDVTITGGGDVNINSTGLYFLTFNLSFGRTGTSGIAIMAARVLLNGSAIGYTQGVTIDGATDTTPCEISMLRSFTAGDVIKVQYVRDSAGTNAGGLVVVDPTLAGWATSPSALARVQKIAGGY